MAAKRPSYKSIRARQKSILEGMGTSDLKYNEAAKRLGVTPRELKRFAETKPSKLRKNFNRSSANQKLYGARTATEQRKDVREAFGVTRIKKYKYRESEIQALKVMKLKPSELRNRTQIGEQVQNLYSDKEHARYEWASYARENDIPTSIDTLKLLHRNNQISDSDYVDAVNTWRAIYNINDTRYAAIVGDDEDLFDFDADDYEESA